MGTSTSGSTTSTSGSTSTTSSSASSSATEGGEGSFGCNPNTPTCSTSDIFRCFVFASSCDQTAGCKRVNGNCSTDPDFCCFRDIVTASFSTSTTSSSTP